MATKKDDTFTPFAVPVFDEEFLSVLQEELDEGGEIDIQMPAIKVPTGGGLAFTLPDEEVSKKIDGVIVHSHPMNILWLNDFDGSSNPPDCVSNNAETGVGYPGGACATCKYNQFGSGRNGGKACKNIIRAYIIVPDQLLPWRLDVPPTSLKEYRDFKSKVLLKGKRLPKIYTRISLETTKSKDGIAYSKLAFELLEPLSNDDVTRAKAYTPAIAMIAGMRRPALAIGGPASQAALPPAAEEEEMPY